MTEPPPPLRGTTATPQIVRIMSPAPRDRWQSTFAADPNALATQSPQWTDTMVRTGGWRDASVLFETSDGRDLVLPLARRSIGGPRGLHASFGEGWGMGGLLAAGGPSSADVAAVLGAVQGHRAVQLTIRPNPMLATEWRSGASPYDLIAVAKNAHVLDLAGGADAVFDERFDKHGRRAVRRAQRMGVVVSEDSTAAGVEVFYGMLLKSFDRWASQSREPLRMARFRATRRDPLHKFQQMAECLGDAMRIHIARVDGTPAAATVVLLAPHNAHYTRGVMDVDVAGRTNASDLAQWAGIQDAIEHGCLTYHMGETGASANLARFKEKFGARAVPYAQYRMERLPLTPADAKLRAAVKRLIGFQDAQS